MNVEEIKSERHFEDVLSSNSQILIDFWAPWCGPCKAMTPIFEQVAGEQELLKAIKVNIDDIPTVAQKYGIRSIPSLLLVKENIVKSEHVGLVSKQELLNWLGEH